MPHASDAHAKHVCTLLDDGVFLESEERQGGCALLLCPEGCSLAMPQSCGRLWGGWEGQRTGTGPVADFGPWRPWQPADAAA